ncbi:sterol 3beta-glucosyltransferase [Silvimonas terrae]|uniref:Sterol 3beta-glucosyltransferase n=1 Tax=Silvimonas terrae TaxID=300266 RepID=A0A840RC83_9NEIS|nr:glycosyltransferase [Silvimonas terrae]MBB5190138.1 sterol 3beta-glucosyltransferase [Silvimonas terrae]
MKLLALTYGTEGDTRPLAALSHALQLAGHKVHLLADGHTLGSAHELGVPASGLSGDIRALFAEHGPKGAQATANALVRLTNAHAANWMTQTLAAARECDGILTAGLAGFTGLSVAESLGIPVIGTGMIPLTPSRTFPSPFLPAGLVPHWLNRASLKLTNQLVWLSLARALNRARIQLAGLPACKSLPDGHPMLYGISPTLLPRPEDWPANAHLCGQWRMPQVDFQPPAELARFLAAGPAPLYIGFGSMAGLDTRQIITQLATALAGRRALFYPGWSDGEGINLPANILQVGPLPHDWLFPQTAAVIHHGGSGTTHSATRAGKPSIVIPFAGDQPFWAARLATLGIAPPAIKHARLDAAVFAAAIRFVEQPQVLDKAAQLGAQMATEDGLGTAVALIERMMRVTGSGR